MSNLVDGRYQLIDVIGAGGMATVWRAQDLRLSRMVAVKRPRPATPSVGNDTPPAGSGTAVGVAGANGLDPSALQARMSREMQLAASLSHPNLVTVHDAGHDSEGLYLVMELVEAPSLAEVLSRSGSLDRLRALTVGTEIADALAAVHRVGIVHRDVKPGNILMAEAGAKLTDFGIATATPGTSTTDATSQTSLTMAGSILGTLNYASPEVLAGEPPTDRSDVFSLAAVVYQMITGRLPFPDGGRMASPPSCGDAALDSIFAEALAHDAWRRPDAATLGARLRSILTATSRAQSPVPPPPTGQPSGDTTSEFQLAPVGSAPGPGPDMSVATPAPPAAGPAAPSVAPVGSTQALPPHLMPDRSVPAAPVPSTPGPRVVGRSLLQDSDQPPPPVGGSAPVDGGIGGSGGPRGALVATAVAVAVILLAGYLVVRTFQGDSVETTGEAVEEEGDGNRVDAGEGDDITPQTLPSTTTTVEADRESDGGDGATSDDGDPLTRTLDELEEALEQADEEFEDSGLPSEEVDDLLDRAREAIDSARDSEELETVRRLDDLRRRIDEAVGDEDSDDSARGRLERLARLLGLGDNDADDSSQDENNSGGDGG